MYASGECSDAGRTQSGQMVETWEYELHHLKLEKNIGTLKIADTDGADVSSPVL